MGNEIWLLMATAGSIGFIHTLLGPDHYLPFIVMSKARNWSTLKTVSITFLCGLGHVAGSIILGALGIAFGIGIGKLEGVEEVRGDWAAWGFLILGVGYLVWAIWRLRNNHHHKHVHAHNCIVHSHEHGHTHAAGQTIKVPHAHSHDKKSANLTPWLLFLVFVLGPCEPLIPLLMYPAAQASVMGVVAVTAVFAITTIATMIGVVLAVNYGATFIKIEKLEKYAHVIAGATVAISGVLILVGL